MKAHNMKNVPPLEIPYDEIEDHVVIPMGEDPSEMMLESPYHKVELFWPLELLQNGVEIIDSPGLNENAIRTRVTMEYLAKADAILMVLNATVLCSETEMEFIANDLKGQGFDDPFFIINRFDCIPKREQDRVKKYATVKLKDYSSFGASGIYFVSALDALDGKLEGDDGKFEGSGMAEFERRLSDFLTRSKGKVKLAQPARELKRILNDEALFKVIPMQRKMLSADLDEVKGRYARVQPKLKDLTTRKEQLRSRLMLRIEQSKHEFRRIVRTNMQELADSVPAWIEAYEPQAKLGLIPTKEKTEAVVKEISEYITKMMNEQQRDWRNKKLTPMIEEKAMTIFESAEGDVAKILCEIDQINVDISGGEYDANTVPTWQRVIGIAGGLAIGDVGLAASAGINGLSKELAKTFAFEAGAGFVLGLLGWLNPVTLCATIVGTFLFNVSKGQSNAIKKLKTNVCADIVKQLETTAEKTSAEMSDSITGKFEDIAEQIVSALDTEINEVNNQIQTIIGEMEKGKENIARRETVIDDCETKIKNLSSKLDELIFQLVKG